jgi:predicted tellurium resistance membrane protein TerC
MLLEWIFSLLTLTAMEIVLGIDNIIFITIMVGRLPAKQHELARRLGLTVALGTRLLLLLVLFWLVNTLRQPLFDLTDLGLTAAWFDADTNEISARDLILIAGGVWLIGKSTFEIHANIEGPRGPAAARGRPRFGWTLVQIALLDIVFSLDSVITALGMTTEEWIMIVAMILAVGVMMFFAGPVGRFVENHPTIKVLALSFLILIGVMLVGEGFDQHLNRGYIYFAMIFAVGVELLNMRVRQSHNPFEPTHELRPIAERYEDVADRPSNEDDRNKERTGTNEMKPKPERN